jgi:thioesterase domain-containing protein
LPAPDSEAYARQEYEAPQGELEEALAGIWQQLLSVERVGRHDNFFALGGHSLLAVRLVALAERHNIKLTLLDPFVRPTLKDLAAHIATHMPVSTDRALCVRESGSEPILFLTHDGTDNLQYLYALAPHLDASIPVYGLPPAPLHDLRFQNIEAMATRMVEMIREVQSEGPYRVAGWSTGGILSYEIANQLLCANQRVDFLGLFDAAYYPDHDSTRVALEHATASLDEKSYLFQLIQLQSTLRSTDERLQRVIAEIRGDIARMELADLITVCHEKSLLPPDLANLPTHHLRQALARRYAYFQAQSRYRAPKISIPLHLFAARTTTGLTTPCLGWDSVLPAAQIRVVTIPGDHYSMMDKYNITTLAAGISRALSRGRLTLHAEAAAGSVG